ncbi:uncharacterized protein V1516DRAFT_675754 [Lipomyces oligophaga]|uniref:uncharacterized protein n=1 Tax=Lipomyces oligophaga TaxID=45792 RepID=UPI0034CEE783
MAQAKTPAQRLANQRYAKREEKKKGKAESVSIKKKAEKPPVSWGWIYFFVFLVAGGLLLELLSAFFFK